MRNLAIAVAAVSLIALVAAGSLIGAWNKAVSLETQIVAAADNNEQILGQFYNKLEETVQVTDIYKDDFKDSMTAMLAGRYGEGGSQAAFQWIQESMPTLDPSMYRSVQLLIEADRNRFQNEQTRLIDLRRQYDQELRSFPSAMWLGVLGFPKLDLAAPQYNAVTTVDAVEVFSTGVETARQLRAD